MTKGDNPLDLLAALHPAARAAIEGETAHLAVPAGHTLFHQGERGDSLYLVLAGTLGVYVPEPTGGERLLALIQSGESVGRWRSSPARRGRPPSGRSATASS